MPSQSRARSRFNTKAASWAARLPLLPPLTVLALLGASDGGGRWGMAVGAEAKGGEVAKGAPTPMSKEAARPSPATPPEAATPLPSARAKCTRPPQVLTPENIGTFGTLSSMAQHWLAVRYLQSGAESGAAGSVKDVIAAAVFPSDYFSALPGGQRAAMFGAGLTKVSAIRLTYGAAKGYTPAQAGVMSDHCPAIASDDDKLLFSLLLKDDLVLQATVERSPKAVAENRPSDSPHVKSESIPDRVYEKIPRGDLESRPMTSIALRVVRLGQGRALAETPKVKLERDGTAGVEITAVLLGDSAEAPVAIGLNWAGAVAIVTRDGRIPLFREGLCAGAYLGFKNYRRPDGHAMLVIAKQAIRGELGAACPEMDEIDEKSSLWLPAPKDAAASP